MGEGWDEGDTPHLTPLPQGERMPSPGRSYTLSQEVKDLFKHPLRPPDRKYAGLAVLGGVLKGWCLVRVGLQR